VSTQIAVLIGSLRRDSYNRRLAQAVQRLAPQEWVFKELRISDLPLYNQDDEKNPGHERTQVLRG
jgi:chromate reductase, NAD(P)H dehydrogenase (quinone)